MTFTAEFAENAQWTSTFNFALSAFSPCTTAAR